MTKLYYTIGIDYEDAFDGGFNVIEENGKQVEVYIIDEKELLHVLSINIHIEDITTEVISHNFTDIKEKLGLPSDEEFILIQL